MKKTKLLLTALIMGLVLPAFAGEAKFTRDYHVSNSRSYDYSEYLDGNYRSNFINIPMNRMLNYLDGFAMKVGVFELDGNVLYVGWKAGENGTAYLSLCDENKNFFISNDSWKKHEQSYFNYEQGLGNGVVTEIELKGKKYTVAIAGISSTKAGIFSNDVGFRMWVENEAPKDQALSKNYDNYMQYEMADIQDGVYKPGWKRLFGTVEGTTETGLQLHRYSYKGTDFIFDGSGANGEKWLKNPDGSLITPSNVSGFYLYYLDANDKFCPYIGLGVEADVQLGKNKVRICYIQYDGIHRVFVKDSKGYPGIKKLPAPAVIEYHDYYEINDGQYNTGFTMLKGKSVNDEEYTSLFEGSGRQDKVYLYEYKGNKFLIGPTQDPQNYVKNPDGSVIFNPQKQLRYSTTAENGEALYYPELTYGWEGKVKLGNKNVTLAFIKWDYAVCVFVKE